MGRKTKDILLVHGYTEADLTAMATMLADPKFCAAIEAEAEAADTAAAQVAQHKKELDDDAAWYRDTAVPTITKAVNDRISAEGRAAKAEAELKAAQDAGLIKVATQDDPNKGKTTETKTAETPGLDPRYIDRDTFSGAVAQVGDVVVMAADIPFEHQELFGSRLKGGVAQLQREFQEAVKTQRFKGTMRDFWETKYKVPEKRLEVAAAETKRHEDEIRADERKKVLSESANPMTRSVFGGSRNPFTNRGTATQATGTDGRPIVKATQPWEKNDSERSGARVSKFAAKVAQIQ
jgi:hypothetical protein